MTTETYSEPNLMLYQEHASRTGAPAFTVRLADSADRPVKAQILVLAPVRTTVTPTSKAKATTVPGTRMPATARAAPGAKVRTSGGSMS